jgi:trehalose synthase
VAKPEPIQIPPQPLDRFRALLGEEYEEIERVAARAREAFAGRAIWHVNSTARGGGVAELLRSMLPYVRAAGVDTRWVVLRESADFFCLTKRIHNRLHGNDGDGGPLGEEERALYESTLTSSGEELGRLCRQGDVIYLHDPQTAGLVPVAKGAGLHVVWRCHIGVDRPDETVRGAWDFLRPYVQQADALVFSRRQYLWDGLDESKVWLMPPVIDPFSPKNRELDPGTVEAILKRVGLPDERLPAAARVVVQVSRWDRLKDPLGALALLDRHLPDPEVHLVLAGPEAGGIADDPEGQRVFAETSTAWEEMTPERRRRAHLLALPMDDVDENATMVNALQRRADVILQKSLAEGFGLTVAEAMWKRRPVIASGVGGIQDQVADGETGILVSDPRDLAGFGAAIETILGDPARARRMGEAGRQRVIDRYLAVNRLREYVDLVSTLL